MSESQYLGHSMTRYTSFLASTLTSLKGAGANNTLVCVSRLSQSCSDSVEASPQQWNEQILSIKQLPDKHVAAVDRFALLKVCLPGSQQQEGPHCAVSKDCGNLAPEHLRQVSQLVAAASCKLRKHLKYRFVAEGTSDARPAIMAPPYAASSRHMQVQNTLADPCRTLRVLTPA